MKLVFIGPPGSGKGTAAQTLAQKFNFQHISTGDIIRENIKQETALGLQVKDILEKGELVSDDLMQDLVAATLSDSSIQEKGFILDGFPRTIVQTEWLISKFSFDYFVFFEAPDDIVIERISGRRIHPASKRIYHVKFDPPKVPDKDDLTGEPIVQRVDDQPEKVLFRLQVYKKETMPIIELLKSQVSNILTVDAGKSASEVVEDIITQIKL